MGGGAGGSFQQSSSKSGSSQQSGTRFPNVFLNKFAEVYGRPFNIQELIAGLPQSQGLFGGQVGLFGPGAPAPPALPYGPTGAGPGLPGAPPAPGGAPAAPTAPRQFTTAELGGYLQGTIAPEALREMLSRHPGQSSFTVDELMADSKYLNATDRERLLPVIAQLQAQERVGAFGQQPNRLTPSVTTPGLPGALPGGIPGALQNLGFGQTPQQFAPAPIGPTALVAPRGANIAPGGFEQFQRDLFESQFRPVERELGRKQSIQERKLQADLAQRGLGASGTGVGQTLLQREDFRKEMKSAAEDATNRASVQRFQMQFQQELANAGFDMEAQTTNADNLLRGQVAQADNYLKTLGINQTEAMNARNSFLNLLNIQEQDLGRMDQFSLGVMDRLLNTWLQSLSATGDVGRYGAAQTAASSKSFGLSGQVSGGVGGG